MRLRILFIFILVGMCLSASYASSYESFQDSIKRVIIKITATEKASSTKFDSLLNAKANEIDQSTIARPKRSRKNNKSAEQFNRSIEQSEQNVNYAEPAMRSPEKTITQPSSSNPQQSAVDVHHEEDTTKVTTPGEETSVSRSLKSSRTYLWVGIMLMVVGVILGILFGKTALLISVAGLIFVIIGYSARFF